MASYGYILCCFEVCSRLSVHRHQPQVMALQGVANMAWALAVSALVSEHIVHQALNLGEHKLLRSHRTVTRNESFSKIE